MFFELCGQFYRFQGCACESLVVKLSSIGLYLLRYMETVVIKDGSLC